MEKPKIKAVLGLGNPGPRYANNRHNIGFMLLDALAQKHGLSWEQKNNMTTCLLPYKDSSVLLVKPQTFMNTSGAVLPYLSKKGIRAENILVIHDELELSLGKTKFRFGGSAKGHNGLRSIIDHIGKDFWRLSFGIGRPVLKADVGQYVLFDFQEAGFQDFFTNTVNELEAFLTE